ncbi:1-acyl-sn-glycerol-3-phosphate acyltransferase delta-like [Diadema antillarum]|uniref:1-acyl-sn-glycerol-3-phosphate acyltransferase delta-like n=1 Tax=Diadema antillarum TaxID=105358 RepID=UPI003A869897
MDVVSLIKSSTLVHIWLMSTLLISALIVTSCQCLTLFLWPFSKRLYRDANGLIMNMLWLELVWLIDSWSGSEVILHMTEEEMRLLGNEHCLLIFNHRQDVDWLVTWQIAEKFKVLRGAKSVMKNELKYVPFFGWSFYLTEQLFVSRDYAKDKTSLMKHFKNITTFHHPCVFLLICEGTRYTKEKYEKSQAFAKAKGLPGLKHHLLPRTKGFNLCVEAYKGKVPALYDATIAYKDGAQSSLYDLLCGKKFVYHIHSRRIPLEEIPTDTEEATSEYCHELYRKKDETYQYFLDHNTFAGYDAERTEHRLPQSMRPKYVMVFWTLTIGLPLIYYTLLVLLSGSTVLMLIVVAIFYGAFSVVKSMLNFTVASKGSTYGSNKEGRSKSGVQNGNAESNGTSTHPSDEKKTD